MAAGQLGVAHAGLQHLLHQHDVEPAAELAADLAFAPTCSKPHLRVQRDRRVVTADDAGDHGVEAVIGGEVEQVAEQELADARPRLSRCTYTESSTVGTYAGRGRKGESDAKPSTASSSSTATIAG